MAASPRPLPLEHVRFEPPRGYDLDVEVVSSAQLRQRGNPAHFARPQRLDFHSVLAVTHGAFRHMIDFEIHVARKGSWHWIRPGQVQRYDFSTPWRGWLLVFRSEALMPSGTEVGRGASGPGHSALDLPAVLRLPAGQHDAALAALQQMRRDACLALPREARRDLLRLQLQTVIVRLRIAAADGGRVAGPAPSLFRRFERLLERDFGAHHTVRHYARALGCSTRTLTRVSLEASGTAAKAVIAGRVALEAKRRLAHTDDAIHMIGLDLGFEEATNFVKFFRSEVGATPGAFRRQYRDD